MSSILNGILQFEESLTNCVIFNKEIIIAPAFLLEKNIRSSNSNEFLRKCINKEPFEIPKSEKFEVRIQGTNGAKNVESFKANFLSTIFCSEVNDLIISFSSDSDSIDNISVYLKSSFILLKINTNNKVDYKIEKLFANLYRKYGPNNKLNVFDDVLTISAPFNSDVFHNTIHLSKISNIKENTLFVLSNLLPRNCEGCPVFNSKL